MIRLFGIIFALTVAACVSLVIQSEVQSIQKSFGTAFQHVSDSKR